MLTTGREEGMWGGGWSNECGFTPVFCQLFKVHNQVTVNKDDIVMDDLVVMVVHSQWQVKTLCSMGEREGEGAD